jgi:hypothetical protein
VTIVKLKSDSAIGACVGLALVTAHKKSGFFIAMIGGR